MQRRTARRSLGIVWLVLTMLLLSSCKTEWLTWGFGNERQGYNHGGGHDQRRQCSTAAAQVGIDRPGAAINTSPIIASGVNINGTPTDVVYVGTEHRVVPALSTTGQVLWFRGLGSQVRTDCLDQPDGVYGITSDPVFDKATNRLYVADSARPGLRPGPLDGRHGRWLADQLHHVPTTEFVSSGLTLSRQQPVHRGGLAL